MIKEEDFYDNNSVVYNCQTCRVKNCYSCSNNLK